MMRSADSIEPSIETSGGASTVVARDETERLRTRTRWGYGGFAIGIGLGFALTAAQVASAGYAILPFQFVWNLIWAPFLGVVIGRALSRTQPIEPSVETSGGASTVVARDETERLRTRTRWGYGGFAIGIGLGFALTAAQVASAGYAILPFEFVWNLIWAPFLGVVIGRALSRTQPIEPSVETSGGASTVVARDETERLRTRTRWGYGGLAIGIGLGFALTAVQVATAGYAILLFHFARNLTWAPFLGLVIGRALSAPSQISLRYGHLRNSASIP